MKIYFLLVISALFFYKFLSFLGEVQEAKNKRRREARKSPFPEHFNCRCQCQPTQIHIEKLVDSIHVTSPEDVSKQIEEKLLEVLRNIKQPSI